MHGGVLPHVGVSVGGACHLMRLLHSECTAGPPYFGQACKHSLLGGLVPGITRPGVSQCGVVMQLLRDCPSTTDRRQGSGLVTGDQSTLEKWQRTQLTGLAHTSQINTSY